MRLFSLLSFTASSAGLFSSFFFLKKKMPSCALPFLNEEIKRFFFFLLAESKYRSRLFLLQVNSRRRRRRSFGSASFWFFFHFRSVVGSLGSLFLPPLFDRGWSSQLYLWQPQPPFPPLPPTGGGGGGGKARFGKTDRWPMPLFGDGGYLAWALAFFS